jgi:hypothetical protein
MKLSNNKICTFAVFLVLIGFAFGVSFNISVANASDSPTTLSDFSEAVVKLQNEKISRSVLTTKIEKLLNNSSDEVKFELLQLIPDDSTVRASRTVELLPGIVGITDNQDVSEEDILTRSLSGKGFGNRKYTAFRGITIAGVFNIGLSLVNHYNVSNKGHLTMRSLDEAGTAIIGTYKFTKKMSDKTANKVGHNIDGYGDYKITIKNLGTYKKRLTSFVKLTKINLTGKYVVVDQTNSLS